MGLANNEIYEKKSDISNFFLRCFCNIDIINFEILILIYFISNKYPSSYKYIYRQKFYSLKRSNKNRESKILDFQKLHSNL